MPEYMGGHVILSPEESNEFREIVNNPSEEVALKRDQHLAWLSTHMEFSATPTGFVITVPDIESPIESIVCTASTYRLISTVNDSVCLAQITIEQASSSVNRNNHHHIFAQYSSQSKADHQKDATIKYKNTNMYCHPNSIPPESAA